MTRTKKVLGGMALLTGLCAFGCMGAVFCLPAYFKHGILVETCPDGGVRGAINVNTYGLERGRVGSVEVISMLTDTLGEPDSEAGTYIGWFRQNAQTIVDALTRPEAG